MKNRTGIRFIALGLALLALAGGCASTPPPGPEPSYPSISDVPPWYYDYNPALRGWYTAPYWNPDTGD